MKNKSSYWLPMWASLASLIILLSFVGCANSGDAMMSSGSDVGAVTEGGTNGSGSNGSSDGTPADGKAVMPPATYPSDMPKTYGCGCGRLDDGDDSHRNEVSSLIQSAKVTLSSIKVWTSYFGSTELLTAPVDLDLLNPSAGLSAIFSAANLPKGTVWYARLTVSKVVEFTLKDETLWSADVAQRLVVPSGVIKMAIIPGINSAGGKMAVTLSADSRCNFVKNGAATTGSIKGFLFVPVLFSNNSK